MSEELLWAGFPSEWVEFGNRHRLFLERYGNLRQATNIAFAREGTTPKAVDRVIFFVGRLCVEDFNEILLMCANGYGVGAMKIVRGMYERAVTARYLHLHPEEADDFLDFHWVQQHRLARAIVDTLGPDTLPGEILARVEASYRAVKDRFTVADCHKCGTKRPSFTWSKLDLVSMAKAAGNLGDLIVPAYYIPTREAHSTAGALLSRLSEGDGGILTFSGELQPEKAGEALITAHNLILNVLDLQHEHFGLRELDEPLKTCIQDFLEIWQGGAKQGIPSSNEA